VSARLASGPLALVIGGVASGVGKTSITLGLLEAFRRRGLAVQAFKVGPDFIDPGFHRLASGRPSWNLDGWMCGRERVLDTFTRVAAGADLAIVEGVMGCFDGHGEAGSTAECAKWLGAPVVLVVDVSAQSRSAAASVLGFERFDPDLDVRAVIVNRVAGDRHAREVLDTIRASCRAVAVGAIRREDDLTLPERHLGLVTARESDLAQDRISRLADAVERQLDLEALLAIAKPVAPRAGRSPRGRSRGPRRATIGVALDAAFQFYYEENLEALRDAGAEILTWSPLEAPDAPNVDGLYLGGGYPELHAARLSANTTLHDSVRRFAGSGRPIYAECGGLMFLADALEDLEGVTYRMVGLVPTTVRIERRRLTLGYVEVRFTRDTPLGAAGVRARGHEFHFSTADPVPERVARAYVVETAGGPTRAEGYLVGATLASYVHLHFGSNPELARSFVDACVRARTSAAGACSSP
jgi:cobyrinic acid a,c-diamide synthase